MICIGLGSRSIMRSHAYIDDLVLRYLLLRGGTWSAPIQLEAAAKPLPRDTGFFSKAVSLDSVR
jgi:hypothetical protein